MTKLHQVFIGCPFATEIRRSYDRMKQEMEAETPLSVVLADTVSVSSSDYLLGHITTLIRDSAGCVFDATGANPNVSLEVGIAHTIPTDFILTLKTRKARQTNPAGTGGIEMRPIISDLQGKNRIEYKNYKALRQQVENRFLIALPYIQRWKRFRTSHRSYVLYALQLFSDIRSAGRSTRARLEAILDGSGIAASDLVAALQSEKLLAVRRGRNGGYFYPLK